MSLLTRIRSGTSVVTRDLASTESVSNTFTGTFNLEADPKVRSFLGDSEAFSLYKLDIRYQPQNSIGTSIYGWARITVSFSTDHITDSSADESGSSVSQSFAGSFPFALKYSAGPFPVSFNKLLYRQYNRKSKPSLPVLKITVATSGQKKQPVGTIFVDWIVKKDRESVIVGTEFDNDPIDS